MWYSRRYIFLVWSSRSLTIKPGQQPTSLPLSRFKFHSGNHLQQTAVLEPAPTRWVWMLFPCFLNWLESPFSFQTPFSLSFSEITSLTILSSPLPQTLSPTGCCVSHLIYLTILPQSVTFWIAISGLLLCAHPKTVVLENRGCAFLMLISEPSTVLGL